MRFSTPALLALAFAVTVPAAPAAAGPTITVRNVESRSSVNGCGEYRFDADIFATGWPAGAAHSVRYHWEGSSGHWPVRTITIPASGKMHTYSHLMGRTSRAGFAWVHVLSPVNVISPKVGYSNPNC